MDVRDVGVALWRQRVLVLLLLVITGAATAAGLVVAPKSYTATATISATISAPISGGEAPDRAQADEDPDALRATLAELVGSRAVAEAVQVRISAERSVAELRRSIHGERVRGTVLVDIAVEDRDPDTAAEIANAVATVLVDDAAADEDSALSIAAADPAGVPSSFSVPDLGLTIGVGLLLAFGLATAAAVARDLRTHTVDDAASVEEAATAPLLAHLTPPGDLTSMPAIAPGTAAADLFRHLRLALEAQAEAGGPRVVVAGVAAGDANVWVGANVALALAGTGRRVLLVDGRMGERFGTPADGVPDTPGLYDVLLGANLETAVSPGPVDLLRVLPAGTYGNASIPDLIAQRFPVVMAAAATGFDHVVVIGPPLEVCEDSRMMAVDSTMVLAVVEATISSGALRTHSDRIRAAGARLLGVVLVGRGSERAVA